MNTSNLDLELLYEYTDLHVNLVKNLDCKGANILLVAIDFGATSNLDQYQWYPILPSLGEGRMSYASENTNYQVKYTYNNGIYTESAILRAPHGGAFSTNGIDACTRYIYAVRGFKDKFVGEWHQYSNNGYTLKWNLQTGEGYLSGRKATPSKQINGYVMMTGLPAEITPTETKFFTYKSWYTINTAGGVLPASYWIKSDGTVVAASSGDSIWEESLLISDHFSIAGWNSYTPPVITL